MYTRELATQSVLQPGKQYSPQQQTAQGAPSSLLDQTRKVHKLEGAPVISWPDGDNLILRTLSLVKKGEVIRGIEVIEEIETFHEKQAASKKRKLFAKRNVVEHYQFFKKEDIEELVGYTKAFKGWELCIGPGMRKMTPANRSRDTIIQAWHSQRILCIVRPAHLGPLKTSKSF